MIPSLSEEYCEGFMHRLLPPGGKFQFKPEVLCLGKNNSLRYQVFYTDDRNDPKAKWTEVESEFLKKNADLIPDIYYRNMVDRDRDEVYISSVGSCKGDSGGPVFVKSKLQSYGSNYVLLGLVSGSRSNISECGGINNPTLYIRIKALTNWIVKHVDKKNLCFQ